MTDRKVYDVTKDGDQWAVRGRDAERAVGRFDTKAEAVERAREVARNKPLAQVVIRKQDGTIQEERTYGKDPFPPKG